MKRPTPSAPPAPARWGAAAGGAFALAFAFARTLAFVAGSAAALMATLGATLVATARDARADESDDLREELLTGSPGTWVSFMKRIGEDPAKVGSVIGPCLRDRTPTWRSPSAYAAAWLVDHAPRDRDPLLFDDVLRRAVDDAEWTAEMIGHLVGDGTGRATWSDRASRRLLDPAASPDARVAAAYALRFETTKANAKVLADAWERASADPRVAAAARESLEAVLSYRFESPAAARRFFDDNVRGSVLDWVLALSRLKDRPDTPVYVRMVAEAKQNVDRVASPAELRRYVSPTETPYVEIRQAAARRAAKIEAQGDAWLPLLTVVLESEHDAVALRLWLEVTARVKVSAGERATALARLVITRLSECCGSPELVVGLLGFLGSVGDAKSVGDAFDILADSKDAKVQQQLLAVAGATGGNEARLAAYHARRRGDGPEAVSLRVLAIEAMGRGAAKSTSGAAAAGEFLRGLLAPRDPASPEKDAPAPAERSAAARWLGDFPGAATVARLAEVARDFSDDAAIAGVAVQSLGRLAAGGAAGAEDAARVLVDLARAVGLGPVRVEAVRQLAKVPATATDSLRLAVVEAVRTALSPGGPRDLGLAGAQTAAALADEGSLEGAFALASDAVRGGAAPSPDLTSALERLVRAVAARTPQADDRIAAGLASLAQAGGLDAAISLAKAAADGGDRLSLQVVRARLLTDRAEQKGRDEAARRADLKDAYGILGTYIEQVPAAARTGPTWEEALHLFKRISDLVLGAAAMDSGEKKSVTLQAIKVAALLGDGPGARWGLGLLPLARAFDLTADERAGLDRLESDLKAAAEGVEPPK